MTRFSVAWTHSVQIYANVLRGEDKRNSSWLTKLLIITAFLTRWCDVILAISEEKEAVEWGGYDNDSFHDKWLDGDAACTSWWRKTTLAFFKINNNVHLKATIANVCPVFVMFPLPFLPLSLSLFPSSPPFLSTSTLAPSHLPSPPPLPSLCSSLPGID